MDTKQNYRLNIIPPDDNNNIITKRPVGRPSIYSTELAKRICRAISTSTASITQICERNPGFPHRDTILEWRFDYPEFSAMYDQARRNQADLLAMEIIEIADASEFDQIINDDGKVIMNTEYVARSRIRMDARKWIACKLIPKVYGDKVQVESTEETEKLKLDLESTREIVQRCMARKTKKLKK